MSAPVFHRVPDHTVCQVCRRTFPPGLNADVLTGQLPCGHDITHGATVARTEQRCHIMKIDTWKDSREFVCAVGGKLWIGWTTEAHKEAYALLRKTGAYGGRHRYSYEVVSADPMVALLTQPKRGPTEQG